MAWARAKRWKRKIVSSRCRRGRPCGPVVAAGTGRTSPPSKNGVSSSGRASSSASASRTIVRACSRSARYHGVMAEACVAAASSAAGRRAGAPGRRVGEERVGAGGVADRLLEHRVLVEGRGGRVLVAQLAVVGDRRLDALQVGRGVAAAQRRARRWPAGPPRAARCARARRPASPPASGRPRRSSRGPARSATATWPGAARPAGRGAGRRSGPSAGCRARSPACAASGAGRRTAGRAPRPGPGTSRGGARPRCRARRPRPGARPRTGGWCRAGGSAGPVALTSDLSTSRASEVDDLAARDRAAGAHVLGRLQREAAGEDGQAPEEHALLAGEQVVAPLDRGAQRLLARARGAAAGGEHVEAVAQPRRDLVERERRHARRGQLDGQRHAVEAAGRSPRSSPRRARWG